MDRIVLEHRFTTHQKISILFYMGAPLIFIIFTLLRRDLNEKGYVALLVFCLIYCLLIAIAFLKRGFIKIGTNLYRGSFLFNKLIFKTKIDFTKRPKLSILKFKKNQKLAFFSVANPDIASEFNAFDIYVLNENHTKRDLLLSLKDENNAKKGVAFLTHNFNLKYEDFSPNFN